MKRVALIFVFVNVALIVALVFLYPHLMVSPGKLIDGHRAHETDCFACHSAFSGVSAEKCTACHKVSDIGLSSTKGIPLVTKEPKVAFHQELTKSNCMACHSDHRGVLRYRDPGIFSHELLVPATQETCEACHKSPQDDSHRRPIAEKCSTCHVTKRWHLVHFDHDTLDTAAKEKCASCHEVPADSMHRRPIAEKCSRCHGVEKWRPAHFDHESLEPSELEQCASCHEVPTDALHEQSETTCRKCHGFDRWTPASFDHDEYFVFDRDHNAKCTVCHTTKDYSEFTCYGCHEHSPKNVRKEHVEEGISDYEDCVRCHRSADEDEAERIWKSIRRGQPGDQRKREDRKGRKKKHDDDDD